MNILVPVDFSAYSDNALKYAIGLAQTVNAKVYILHSYRLTKPFGRVAPGTNFSIRDELDAETLQRFEKVKKDILEPTNLDFEFLIDIGFAVDTILSNIIDHNIRLVIMGSKGNGMIHQMFGSTTLNVINRANCAVLSIPLDAKFNGLKEIAIASNHSEDPKVPTLKTVSELIKGLESQIHILSINHTVGSNGKYSLNKYFPKDKIRVHHETAESVENGLSRLADKLQAELLILLPRNKDQIRKLFGHSTTRSMVIQNRLPIMALNV